MIVPNTYRCLEVQGDFVSVVVPYFAPDDSIVVRGKEGCKLWHGPPQLVNGAWTVPPPSTVRPDQCCAKHVVMLDLYLDAWIFVLDVQNGEMLQVGFGSTLGAAEENKHD